MFRGKNIKVTLVELPPTQYGKIDGEPSRDVYSLFRLPARALHYLEAVLREEGIADVEVINPIYHGIKRRLSERNWRRIISSDILGVSAITRTSPQSLELGKKYKEANPAGNFWIGGSDAKFRATEYAEAGADVVFKGESEETLREVARAMQDSGDLLGVKGITFRNGNNIIDNDVDNGRKLMDSEQLSKIHPIYDEKTREGVYAAAIETSRGCPHKCGFCSVSKNYGRRYRRKSIEFGVQELRNIADMGKVLFFVDDNFGGNPNQTEAFLEQMIAEKIRRKGSIQVCVSAKAAKHVEMLELMRKAGIDTIYVGFESVDNASLMDIDKASNAEENREAVRVFREYGFWVHGMLTPNPNTDTHESLSEMLNWAKQSLDSVQFFPLTPFPGTDLWRQIEIENRFLTRDYSLFDAQHVVVMPRNLTPFQMQKKVYDMYEEFYSLKESVRRLARAPRIKPALGTLLYTSFLGGIKKVLYDKHSLEHLEFLRSLG